MSQATASTSADEFLKGVIPLLQEYKQKLDSFREKLLQIRENYDAVKDTKDDQDKQFLWKFEYLIVGDLLKKLQPAARSLAQHVSQRVEHAAMDDLARLELRLRLAEFESALAAAETTFTQYRF